MVYELVKGFVCFLRYEHFSMHHVEQKYYKGLTRTKQIGEFSNSLDIRRIEQCEGSLTT